MGWGTAPKFWSKATRKERKDPVIEEVVRSEEEQYKVKALSQRQQGRWTTWEGVVDRTIKWWKTPQARLSFLIPSPSNLSRWYGFEENCHLPKTILQQHERGRGSEHHPEGEKISVNTWR